MLNWIKEHWLLTGGILIALIVLYLLYKHGQQAAASGSSPDLSDEVQFQQLQTAANMQNSQIEAQYQLAQLQGQQQVDIINAEAAGQEGLANISAGVQNNSINTEGQIYENEIANQGQLENIISGVVTNPIQDYSEQALKNYTQAEPGIIAALLGQGAQYQSALTPAQVAQAQASIYGSPSAILGGIGNVLGNIF